MVSPIGTWRVRLRQQSDFRTPTLVKPWAIPAAFFNRREPSISKRSSLSVSLGC
jgi:hypothetical protein